jgi:YfiH family protein
MSLYRTAPGLAAIPGLRHGFFTRKGGVSEGVLASLNCGYSGGDEEAVVAENRGRAMASLGLPRDRLCTAKQVHGIAVHHATAPTHGPPVVEADALVTDRPGLAIGVLSADCASLLLADPAVGVLGAAHAGWRGALAGVIEAVVEAMAAKGAEPKRIQAAVGPCIARPSYEVGPDMRAEFERDDPAGLAWFEALPGSDRLSFDLKAYALDRLRRAGVEAGAALADDTFADEAAFFSARRSRRRSEERFGLLLSAIALV